MNKNIAFIDTETEVKTRRILDIGGIDEHGVPFHSNSNSAFIRYLHSKNYLCGHNIIKHDVPILESSCGVDLSHHHVIDTLYLSPLLFPSKPYHALLKDDKLQTDELNNPLNDAMKARDLFYDEVCAFNETDNDLKQIYFGLLGDEKEFASFFRFINYTPFNIQVINLIQDRFRARICSNVIIDKLVKKHPIEAAYCLALINTNSRYSITPPWVCRNYPDIERIMFLLRSNPCITGCSWCNMALDATAGLKKWFGYDAFRSYGGKPLQEIAVRAAVYNKSVLAVFPTGGGKSITFQVPALMSGENVKGLTVVISPLQSLMKDQVDNLEKSSITEAVTINGLLDPVERAKSFERVENGSASLLYISPESLRSKSIEHLLLGRNVVRFVIDEAHCFSSWGQDFRVDYLYIGDFIRSLQEKKHLEYPVPVSCFTATAKQNVIEDIRNYFQEKLSIQLEVYSSNASRTNLHYNVIPEETEEEKYATVRNLLDGKQCPAIIYVSRTQRAYHLAERLSNDGYPAKPYHGKMDKQEKSEAALEEAGYLRRGQNMPRIFATSILSKNAQEAIEKITISERFNENQKQQAVRIIKKLFSSKSRKHAANEEAESRIDYISDHLGIVKEDVINVINLLREENILADTKDLTAFIKRGENINRSLAIVLTMGKIEDFLLQHIEEVEKTFHIKELNELAEQQGCSDVSPIKLRTVLNFWAIKNWIKQKNSDHSSNHVTTIANYPRSELKDKIKKRHELARFIVEFLYKRSNETISVSDSNKELHLVEFSVHELKQEYEQQITQFKANSTIQDIEDTLFYLSRINALKIDGGFLVIYNKLSIERFETDNKRRYKADDYTKLKQYYENKIQQIHIVGEYAKKMITDYREALQFVEDYFHLNYYSFLDKYFNVSRQKEMIRNITPEKFRKLFGELSPSQLNIIKDNSSQYIVVAAGPGSGKTKVLVHKLASLLLMEDVKHDQLLMITFSRAAATEFKKRLVQLIGNASHFIEIKTFHSYCFDLLGRVGSIEKSDSIIRKTVEKIRNNDIEPNRISKTVLVIDEAQDMDSHEFELITALMEKNDEMRVIAVGDDDQNIYEFRGAHSKYLEQFITKYHAKKYELNVNFRSKSNLVGFTNQFVVKISHRLKVIPIVPDQNDNGSVKIIRYSSGHLITPAVSDVLSTDLTGTTCVLTQTNDEALQVTGLLIDSGIPAKILQTNDGFSLYNMLELRYLIEQLHFANGTYIISDSTWNDAKRALWYTYKESTKIDICINLVKEFESCNPKKRYQSDLEVFIRDARSQLFDRSISSYLTGAVTSPNILH